MIRRLTLPAVLLFALLVAGCGSGGGGYGGNSSSSTPTTSSAPTSSAGGGTVATASTGVGTVLVDGKGRTLYVFDRDHGGQSACSGACAANWPPALASGAPAGKGVDKGKLGTIKRSDGGRQVTFAGHPVYRFSGDQAAGDTNGQGQNAFGGKWYAVAPSGTTVTATAGGSGSGGSGSGGSSGGGY